MQDIWPVTPKEVMIYTMRTFLLDVSILYEFFFFLANLAWNVIINYVISKPQLKTQCQQTWKQQQSQSQFAMWELL